jgi:hypothetical protein
MGRDGVRIALLIAGLAWVSASAAPAAEACPPNRPFGRSAPCWNGPDGERLPFDSFEAAEAFLRESRVLETRGIGEGRTRPQKLLLERDGVRAHAVFRHVDSERRNQRLQDGRLHLLLSDSYRNDLAAYRLSRLLGFDRVPPAVERRVDGRRGSVQLWIEGALMEKQRRNRGLEPPDPADFDRQRQMLDVFDALVCNIDRNLGNILVDGDWNIWYIDQTRTFARYQEPVRVSAGLGLDRGIWARLASVPDDEIRAAVEPWLSRWQIRDLVERRRALVEGLRSEIARQGELNAFF